MGKTPHPTPHSLPTSRKKSRDLHKWWHHSSEWGAGGEHFLVSCQHPSTDSGQTLITSFLSLSEQCLTCSGGAHAGQPSSWFGHYNPTQSGRQRGQVSHGYRSARYQQNILLSHHPSPCHLTLDEPEQQSRRGRSLDKEKKKANKAILVHCWFVLSQAGLTCRKRRALN